MSEGRLGHAERLRDLRAPGQCNNWLWALGSQRNELLPAEDYVTAVCLRLGATIFDEDLICGLCGDVLD
ncbi:hypothetical protein, partial [Pseudomonas sp. GW101-1A09]|uniref:hypothetical protein n=1 Tax=Pseudomonas sp. GW101-1A09 TaxID=2070588 RepID=UPI001C44B17A